MMKPPFLEAVATMKPVRATIFVLALLSGCATPLPKSESIPAFSGKPPATVGIVVVDDRPFILDGSKEEWFEGIFRGAFGIPHSLQRPGESSGQPFAMFLSSKLQDSLKNAGSNASVIKVAKGTSLEKVIARVKNANVDSGLVVMMFQSRYDLGAFKTPEYGYHFELIVLDRDGKTLARKTFREVDLTLELSDKYNLFDYMTIIYRDKFKKFLNDPEIKSALTKADAG